MSCNCQIPLVIRSGVDFSRPYGWGQSKRIYKAITGITKAAPAVITAPAHGMPDGWRFWVESVKGMVEINRPRVDENGANLEPYTGTVLSADTIEINPLNALDFSAYASGGTIVYAMPYDLTGFTGECIIQTSENDQTPLLTLNTANGGVVIDNTLKTITLVIPLAQVDSLSWVSGFYLLDVISPAAVRSRVAIGPVTVVPA